MVLDELPQLVSSGFFQRLVHPVAGEVALPGVGLRSPDVDFGYEAPAPTLGQHTAAVLREKLGCTDAELSALVAEGAIGPLGPSEPIRPSDASRGQPPADRRSPHAR
jgi:crotonobetainyl-CoA:carnitine CoA-transferase CaiB-like acyl-CoA transferase